jgi:hypothetical protein
MFTNLVFLALPLNMAGEGGGKSRSKVSLPNDLQARKKKKTFSFFFLFYQPIKN